MHLSTLLFTTAALLTTAYAQEELFDQDYWFQPATHDCYCRLPKVQDYTGKDMKDLGSTKYCCDAAAGVDDPNIKLKPGQPGIWDKDFQSCNPDVVGPGAKDQDNFAKCCAFMLLVSSCRDPNKKFYTHAEIVAVDGTGKLTFGNTEEGDEPPYHPDPARVT